MDDQDTHIHHSRDLLDAFVEVEGIRVPMFVTLPPLSDIPPAPLDIEGMESCGPITIEGTWDAGVDLAVGVDRTVTVTIGNLDELPRKMKKRAKKWLDGRPLGRREGRNITLPFRRVTS